MLTWRMGNLPSLYPVLLEAVATGLRTFRASEPSPGSARPFKVRASRTKIWLTTVAFGPATSALRKTYALILRIATDRRRSQRRFSREPAAAPGSERLPEPGAFAGTHFCFGAQTKLDGRLGLKPSPEANRRFSVEGNTIEVVSLRLKIAS